MLEIEVVDKWIRGKGFLELNFITDHHMTLSLSVKACRRFVVTLNILFFDRSQRQTLLELSSRGQLVPRHSENSTREETFPSLQNMTQRVTRQLGKWRLRNSIITTIFHCSLMDFVRPNTHMSSSPDKVYTICWSTVDLKYFL